YSGRWTSGQRVAYRLSLFFRETLTAIRHWLYPAGHPAMRQVINFEFSLKNDGLQDPRPATTKKFNDDGCRQ
ncbi:hypothetical protein, partial [Klebsiella pneumoniae]|uniref:hypothetical protein n=1 Tax=Klebsiella pneumoniae TaxID=573 RepID=UPI00272FE34D